MVGMIIGLIYDEVRRIWVYRVIAGLVAAVIFALAASYILLMPNIYESHGQLLVDKQTSLAAATEGVSFVRNTDETSIVEKTILSDASLQRLISPVDPGARTTNDAAMRSAADRIRRNTEITTGDTDGGRFIDIQYSDKDPTRARDVARALVHHFVADTQSRKARELSGAEAFLGGQIADQERKMMESQVAIATFRRAYPSVNRLDPNVVLASGGQQTVRSTGGGVTTGATAAPRAVPTFSPPQDGPIADLEGRLASLRTQYTEEYPDIIVARRQLANLQAQRIASIAAYNANPPPAAPVAAAAPSAPVFVNRGGSTVRAAPLLAPDVSAKWAELLRKDELLSARYKDLIERQQMTMMSQALTSQNSAFQITREPELPVAPSSPNRPLYLALALLAALAAGVAAAYLRGAITGIFVSAREVEEICQLPVIGTVSWEPAWNTGKVATKSPALPIAAATGIVMILVSIFFLVK